MISCQVFFVEIDVNVANKRDYIITINISRQHFFDQEVQIANNWQTFCNFVKTKKLQKQRSKGYRQITSPSKAIL